MLVSQILCWIEYLRFLLHKKDLIQQITLAILIPSFWMLLKPGESRSSSSNLYLNMHKH